MKTRWILALILTCTFVARAQQPDNVKSILSSPQVRRAFDYIKASEPEAINEQIRTCEIPAPTLKEQRRAEYYKGRFTELGLKNVRIDGAGNVIGERPGAGGGPVLVLAAHLDTVFPEGTDVSVKREGNILKGPGIGDDCRGLTVILSVARALNEAKIETRGTIIFVANVGEEGLGDLRGVRHLFNEELKGRITHFISVDGTGLRITTAGVGSNRYRVTFRGPGGHSYGAFGMPSPIHALGRAIEKISRFQVPKQPKTTFNVGRIEGGTSVNSIAHTAWMEVDMRSESAAELARVDAQFKRAVQEALDEENAFWQSSVKLTVEAKLVGQRPVGEQPADAPIIRVALAADAAMGIKSATGASSTDSNLPMSLKIPAITIDGGGKGRGAHSPEESFDTTDSFIGTQRALLIALGIVGLKQ
ncbi:MAG TPA: M20/M25/M40 family metallo-hydrolase [Blastocatellia bacterium]|nr:M20/M25/M40 family metallo-hydrolase [Blastocatellia bacterium]